MNIIYAIQLFDGEKWKSLYVTSYKQDIVDTYIEIRGLTAAAIRAVSFAVDGFDFIATHARDFAVLAQREAA